MAPLVALPRVHREFGLKFWAFVSGGGALPGPLEQFWNALGFVLVQGYGMTETTALITLNHPFHVAEGTIGKPLAGREVKLAPDGEVLVRGAVISGATWQGGALRPRSEEWLATGDIAERQASGELRFLGRKSEVIVTAAGVNLHPEDIEAAIEEQPEVAACAVVAMDTPTGPGALRRARLFAVRAIMRAAAIERANAKLPSFSASAAGCCGRSPICPAPPPAKSGASPSPRGWPASSRCCKRTVHPSQRQRRARQRQRVRARQRRSFGPSSDWLLALIAQITGEAHPAWATSCASLKISISTASDACSLAAAIEERLGIVEGNGLLEEVQTLGELRRLVAGVGVAESVASDGAGCNGSRSMPAHAPRLRLRCLQPQQPLPANSPQPLLMFRPRRPSHKNRRVPTSSIPSGRGSSRSMDPRGLY